MKLVAVVDCSLHGGKYISYENRRLCSLHFMDRDRPQRMMS
jgi:hypothetical protein